MELKSSDTYKVISKSNLSSDRLNAFMVLYQPLVGGDGILVYLTLQAEAGNSRVFLEHRRLFALMENITAETFQRARMRLEACMLLKSYVRKGSDHDSYLYVLNTPMSGSDFFSTSYFSDCYREKVGEKQFSLSRGFLLTSSPVTEGYTDISAPVVNTGKRSFDNETEYVDFKPRYQFRGEDSNLIDFDYDRFLVIASNLVFPPELRTQENMYLIGKLATLYGITPDRMLVLVGRVININTMSFDRQKLEILARREKPAEQGEKHDRYAISPVSFLMSYQKGNAISKADRQMLEYLSNEMKFPNEVINVMIEYILKISDNRLNPQFVGLVSGSWARDGVDTKEKAIAETKKDSSWKPHRQKTVKKVEMPSYWNEKPEQKTMSDEARKRLMNKLKEMK